jgi:hypothetical protein
MNHNRSPAAIPIEGSCQSRASGVNSHPPAATITPDVGSHDKPGGLDRKSLVSPFVKNAPFVPDVYPLEQATSRTDEDDLGDYSHK